MITGSTHIATGGNDVDKRHALRELQSAFVLHDMTAVQQGCAPNDASNKDVPKCACVSQIGTDAKPRLAATSSACSPQSPAAGVDCCRRSSEKCCRR